MNTPVTPPLAIDPIGSISSALGINKQATRFLVGGYLALLLALFIWQKMQGDTVLYWQLLAALLGVSILMSILSILPLMANRLLAWVLVLCLCAWVSSLTAQVISGGRLPIGTPTCIAYLSFDPTCRISNVQAAKSAPVVETIEATSPAPSNPHAPVPGLFEHSRVFIQFAGMDRNDVIVLASDLKRIGWDVQGAERGGERIGAAAGLNQIRFFHADDRVLAEKLAQDISATLKSRPILQVKDLSGNTGLSAVPQGQLEAWISR